MAILGVDDVLDDAGGVLSLPMATKTSSVIFRRAALVIKETQSPRFALKEVIAWLKPTLTSFRKWFSYASKPIVFVSWNSATGTPRGRRDLHLKSCLSLPFRGKFNFHLILFAKSCHFSSSHPFLGTVLPLAMCLRLKRARVNLMVRGTSTSQRDLPLALYTRGFVNLFWSRRNLTVIHHAIGHPDPEALERVQARPAQGAAPLRHPLPLGLQLETLEIVPLFPPLLLALVLDLVPTTSPCASWTPKAPPCGC